jgi:hypothetical protein
LTKKVVELNVSVKCTQRRELRKAHGKTQAVCSLQIDRKEGSLLPGAGGKKEAI